MASEIDSTLSLLGPGQAVSAGRRLTDQGREAEAKLDGEGVLGGSSWDDACLPQRPCRTSMASGTTRWTCSGISHGENINRLLGVTQNSICIYLFILALLSK